MNIYSHAKHVLYLLPCFAIICMQVGYAATTNYEVTPGTSIPDNACPTYTNTTINAPDNFIVTDINVGLVIDHTYRRDLIVRL